MGISSWSAGIIRPIPVAPTGPFQDGAAPGVWTLDQVAYWLKQGLWPIAGNAAPIGLFGGGTTGSVSNVIDRVVIASAGNATDFGDLTVGRSALSAASSTTLGVFAGGQQSGGATVNIVDYVTIASTGNATDFGDLLFGDSLFGGCSNANGGL